MGYFKISDVPTTKLGRFFMKKIICLMLSLSIIFTLSTTAFASTTSDSEADLPGNATSIKEMFEFAVTEYSNSPATISAGESGALYLTTLENAAGDVYNVQLFEYSPATVSTEDEVTQTFVFSTDSDYVTPMSTHSQTNEGWDSSISVYGYLTIKYSRGTYNSTYTYLLTNVSGGWEREDSSVTITDRYVAYTCQSVLDNSQLTYKYPSANTFNYPTGYSTYIYDDSLSAVVGAVSIADLQHGSSSAWQLITRAFIIENDITDLMDTEK